MTGYIQTIKTKIPYSTREVEIDVMGKNLILTGGNGCGKTQLLNFLYEVLKKSIVNRQHHNEQELVNNINHFQSLLENTSKASANYNSYLSNINTWQKQLEETRNPPISLSELEQFVVRYHERKALFSKFDATRQANIKASRAAVSKEKLKQEENNERQGNAAATLFEEYLVSHKTSQAYAESPSIDNNPAEAQQIKEWFDKLEKDLRELFEDQSLKLNFDSKEQTFFIKQNNKEPYRLQQLSSGFSSILSVYADLLTKVELRSIAPDEIDGVVFIDEIDAHLHVSLQRKIFSFLDKAFPRVQFIVTTHSPFVVSSVDDAVIYDLSRLEHVDDLSMYSYESVLEGLFNVLPVSEILKSKILKMSEMASSTSPDITELERLVNDVRQHENKLDDESKFFLKTAQLVVNKVMSKGV
ncbi:AAA family ATPase [Aliivibrio fischeri]|uniref:AAA family ATPase n=1 Tax=Aliivibrio fischeri TaxID=668 RepID=UPI0016633359|nr:AAA family ATPase [Aliivibrio fischeri]USR94307.1 AAA family ATPase [Aliivibrio fischeri ATCC 7744 = JCM 18803 = DSM 507]GGK26333.1 ATPase AAA [Aliivibrio fischeri]